MKGRIRSIALIGILAGLVGSAAASTNGSIAGTVVDQSDQPIAGVVVNSEMTSMGYYATKVADIDGAFSVGNLEAATYTLTSYSPGFATLNKDVLLRVSDNVHQTFVMTASP